MKAYKKNRGVALVSTLLLLSIATVVAVSITSQQQLMIHKTNNIQRLDQAWSYIFALENWAREALAEDSRRNFADSAGDIWHQGLDVTEISGGRLQAAIIDQQAKYNINNLVRDGEVVELERLRLRALLAGVGIETELADSIVDWLDHDAVRFSESGAEDSYYLGLEPSYRAANRPIQDISELLMVRGFKLSHLQLLKPHITALPGYVPVNINAASETVLQAVLHRAPRQAVSRLIESRNRQAFDSRQQLLSALVQIERELDLPALTVQSAHFQLHSQVELQPLYLEVFSLLQRQPSGQTDVLLRTQGGMVDG